MAVELLAIDKAINNALLASTDVAAALAPRNVIGLVHSDEAPIGTQPPFIVFTNMSNYDIDAMGGFRAFSPAEYIVCAHGVDCGYGGIKAIADAIDAVLQQKDIVDIDGVTVYKFSRSQVIRASARQGDERWFQLGGVYSTATSS